MRTCSESGRVVHRDTVDNRSGTEQYNDCDDATVEWAFERLCPEGGGETSSDAVSIPRFWAADIPRSSIVCLQDRAMPRWLSDLVADRLGVDQLTIDASHSPRPKGAQHG